MTTAESPSRVKFDAAGLTDNATQWLLSIADRQRHSAPRFCRWLRETIVAELERRSIMDGSPLFPPLSLEGWTRRDIAEALRILAALLRVDMDDVSWRFLNCAQMIVTAAACRILSTPQVPIASAT